MASRLDRRLSALEQREGAQQAAADGYAPESWSRLAPWAIAVHHAGGWQAAIALVKERGMQALPQPNRYGPTSGGPTWDIVTFWQRGDTGRMPSQAQSQDALRLITYGVAHLLEQGLSETEIVCWDMGRQAWHAIMEVLEGTVHEQP